MSWGTKLGPTGEKKTNSQPHKEKCCLLELPFPHQWAVLGRTGFLITGGFQVEGVQTRVRITQKNLSIREGLNGFDDPGSYSEYLLF